MDLTQKPTTLAERVYCLLAKDDPAGGRGLLDRCHKPVIKQLGGGMLTTHELDLMDWALTMGLAFGLARVEDACECEESVAERAYSAARAAYDDWGGGIGSMVRPEVAPHVKKVADAYVSRESSREMSTALEDALIGLVGAVGGSEAVA